jgi:Spy/CpxP family protein refolding chaperone
LRRLIMRKTSIKLIIGAAAVAFAAALIFPAFAAAQEAKTAPPARPERPARMLAREALDITPEQEKALAEFRKARMEEARAFREEMSKLREEMRGLARDPQANQAKLDALIDRTAKLRAEREKTAFRNRIAREKVFTPDQLEKMKTFRQRLANRPGMARRAPMAFGRVGVRGPGRLMARGFGPERMARLRALRHRQLLRRWRDR